MEAIRQGKENEFMYLDYVNNFLTVERFAEYYDLTIEEANLIIDKGRIINNSKS
jgi:hypothetical protein